MSAKHVVIEKNVKEQIHVFREPFQRVDLIHCRVFAMRENGTYTPSRKGVSLRPELWRAILPALSEIVPPEPPDFSDDDPEFSP